MPNENLSIGTWHILIGTNLIFSISRIASERLVGSEWERPRLEFWPFSGPFRVQKIIFSFRKIFSQYSVPYRTRNPWHSEH